MNVLKIIDMYYQLVFLFVLSFKITQTEGCVYSACIIFMFHYVNRAPNTALISNGFCIFFQDSLPNFSMLCTTQRRR